MKSSNLFFLSIIISLTLLIGACKQESKVNNTGESATPAQTTVSTPPNVSVPGNMTPVSGPPPTQTSPAQNAKGAWHYKCPKGCEGGSGTAAACPKCATMMEHNQEYHNN